MNGCRVGRVLRRLEDGERVVNGDLYLRSYSGEIVNVSKIEYLYLPRFHQPHYRPLTPEEVEDYKRRME